MVLRLAQATNAEAIWGEMETEYHTFLNDAKEPWKRSEFQFKRPSPKQLGQFAPLAALKVWIHFASGEHYFVYLVGKSSSGSGRDVKVLAGNLIRSSGG